MNPMNPMNPKLQNNNVINNTDSLLLQNNESLVGTKLQNYEIISKISQGGMGIIYKAKDTSINRIVAIKMILNQKYRMNQQQTLRFLREEEICAKLNHPNVIKIFTAGLWNQNPYIVMEYIEGMPLLEYLKKINTKDYHVYAQLMYKILQALIYIHQQNIIHRDIKPSNILVRENGEPVLIDFGIAKLTQDKSWKLTRTGDLLGSANMSPEQAQGLSTRLDCRSDIYSIGTVFYEMLTGTAPFFNTKTILLLKEIINTPVIPPRKINSNIPKKLEEIICKSLEKNPDHRYQSALEMAQEIQAYLKGNDKISFHYQNLLLYRSHKQKINIVIVIISLLCIVSCVMLLQYKKNADNNSNSNKIVEQEKKPIKKDIPSITSQDLIYLGRHHYRCLDNEETVEEYRHKQTGIEFIYLPSNLYKIGKHKLLNIPVHAFMLAKYECTQGIWKKIMHTTPWKGKEQEDDNLPANWISWDDCQEFCQKTGLQLPSEVQWEAAYRGKNSGHFYWLYQAKYILADVILNHNWTQEKVSLNLNNEDEESCYYYAWVKETSKNAIHPVGKKMPNAYGFYDMTGNVAEWCEDDADSHYLHLSTEFIDPITYTHVYKPVEQYKTLTWDNTSCKPWIESPRKNEKVIRGTSFNDSRIKQVNDFPECSAWQRIPKNKNEASRDIGVRFIYPISQESIQNSDTILQNTLKKQKQNQEELYNQIRKQRQKKFSFIANNCQSQPHNFNHPDFIFLGKHTYKCASNEKEVEEYYHKPTDMEFVYIPAATFTLNQKSYYVTAFLASKYECNQGTWIHIMKTEPWLYYDSHFRHTGFYYPAIDIHYEACIEFAQKTGLSLPTENQWNYMERAGKDSTYFWGTEETQAKNYAWYWDNTWGIELGYSHEIGHKLPNAFGIFDICGNAREWLLDTEKNSKIHLLQGGGFADGINYLVTKVSLNDKYTDCFFGVRFVYNIK